MSHRLLPALAICLLASACSDGPGEIPISAETARFNGDAEPIVDACVKGDSVQYFETYEGLAGQDLIDAQTSCFGFLVPADLADNTPYNGGFCLPGWVPFAQDDCGCGCIDESQAFEGGVPAEECVGQPGDDEICDGLDNDCDGLVDEGGPGDGEDCDTGDDGVCANGITACIDGGLLCVQLQDASEEVCDGDDNDCDGAVDEGDPGGGAQCDTGRPGICTDGVQACIDGAIQCAQTSGEGPETCNGLDDDCNGVVDDDPTDAGSACDTGLDGLCGQGAEECQAARCSAPRSTSPRPRPATGRTTTATGRWTRTSSSIWTASTASASASGRG